MRAPERTITRARALRREMTLPEVVLWEHLRGKRLSGLAFRRQHPIGPYVLDFFCAEARLAVEVDGAVHDVPEQAMFNRRRDQWLIEKGITVVRIEAADILRDRNLEDVLRTIAAARRDVEISHAPPPNELGYRRRASKCAPHTAPPPTCFARSPSPASQGRIKRFLDFANRQTER